MSSSSDLIADLRDLVIAEPGHTGRYYARALCEDPYFTRVNRHEVNSRLYHCKAFTNLGDEDHPAWYVLDSVGPGPDLPPSELRAWHLDPAGVRQQVPIPTTADELSLAGWQREAHDQWYRSGCAGVVEAVTGSGKTRLAMAIIANEMECRRPVLVLVPKVALQAQWAEEVLRWFPDSDIDLVGGSGYSQTGSGADVVVGVVNTVANHWSQYSWIKTVIADECHNYGAGTFRQALLPNADRRLGLTATLERLDGAVKDVLEPYFGGRIYSCGFRRAHQDGRLADARIGLVGVRFSPCDQDAYDRASETLKATRTKLIRQFGVSGQPFGEFMKEVAILSSGSSQDPATLAARRYLKARNERIQLLANCPAKVQMISDLVPHIEGGGGTLIFSERIEVADSISRHLRMLNLEMPAYHSDIPQARRDDMLADLREGCIDGLCTAKALDEGIDVPAVDLGIIAAGTQQRRQMVQRLGRVLRPKKPPRPGRFLIAFVHGTIEDPACGAHEGFLELVADVPGSIRIFKDATDVSAIGRFLDGDDSVGRPLPAHYASREPEGSEASLADEAVAKDVSSREEHADPSDQIEEVGAGRRTVQADGLAEAGRNRVAADARVDAVADFIGDRALAPSLRKQVKAQQLKAMQDGDHVAELTSANADLTDRLKNAQNWADQLQRLTDRAQCDRDEARRQTAEALKQMQKLQHRVERDRDRLRELEDEVAILNTRLAAVRKEVVDAGATDRALQQLRRERDEALRQLRRKSNESNEEGFSRDERPTRTRQDVEVCMGSVRVHASVTPRGLEELASLLTSRH